MAGDQAGGVWRPKKDIPHSPTGFIRFINLKSLRARTLESYLSWVTHIAKHHGVACASLLNQEQVLTFLHQVQQTKGYEGSTLNQSVCALRLFYRDFLERSEWTCWQKIKIKRTPPFRMRTWWQQHRHPIYLFPGIGRGWKEKWGDQATVLLHAAKPMSDSSVQVAMPCVTATPPIC